MVIPHGSVFLTPAGHAAVSVGMKDDRTVTDGTGKNWPVMSCRPATKASEIAAHMQCPERPVKEVQPGFTVECLHCVRAWGTKAQIWTPCCGQVRRNLSQGGAAKCAVCKRWWRLFMGAEHKLVYLGKRKPFDMTGEYQRPELPAARTA